MYCLHSFLIIYKKNCKRIQFLHKVNTVKEEKKIINYFAKIAKRQQRTKAVFFYTLHFHHRMADICIILNSIFSRLKRNTLFPTKKPDVFTGCSRLKILKWETHTLVTVWCQNVGHYIPFHIMGYGLSAFSL